MSQRVFPKVSIIVVMYNQQEFAHETLNSLLGQTYPNIEIIVCDDGSRDQTPDIIKQYSEKYPAKIVPILHPVNTGIAENVNRGLKIASGEYIHLFGGDDIMFPDKIKKQVEYLEVHPEYSGCYHEAEVFEWPSGKVIGLFSSIFGFKPFIPIHADKYIDPKYQLLPSTILMRSSAIANRLFDIRFSITSEFLFYAELIIYGGPLGYLNDLLVRYRKSMKSIGKSETAKKKGFEEALMILAVMESRYPGLSRPIKKKYLHAIYHAAAGQIRQGNMSRFRELCLLCMRRGSIVKGMLLLLFGPPILRHLYSNQSKYSALINSIRRRI